MEDRRNVNLMDTFSSRKNYSTLGSIRLMGVSKLEGFIVFSKSFTIGFILLLLLIMKFEGAVFVFSFSPREIMFQNFYSCIYLSIFLFLKLKRYNNTMEIFKT